MCGLLGFGGRDGTTLVERLIGGMQHRGPDDQGLWSSPEIALGHRRLSIIGLDRSGRQPMISNSGKSVLVYNGEIYNYLELADELERLGRRCDRRFDTSVLLEALETWGLNALPKLNGMFAFAWYRPEIGDVVLARDRWGKKPLFFGSVKRLGGGSYLAFSSELRTFAQLPGGPPAPDPLGVARYLVYDGMPGERTIYQNVSKVPAASWASVDIHGRIQNQGTYWKFDPVTHAIDPQDAQAQAADHLTKSLNLRLRSDVPVGLFLSGGMDSSILAAIWRQQNPDATIRSFTVGFEDASYDERSSAQLMAQAIGSEHHEIVATGDRLAQELDAVLNNLPEPLADPSIVATSLLCRFARDHVKVAISGDGADEFQAGYDPFNAWTTAKVLTSVLPGEFLDSALGVCERVAPASASNLSLKFKLHHFRQGLSCRKDERIQGWMASFPVALAQSMMKPELAEHVDVQDILAPTRDAYQAAKGAGELHAQIHTWIATYLESSILAKVDRASMMHSLEVRSPFLDPDVAASLTNLPPSLIYRRGRGKILLRALARDLIPVQLLEKPKKGFGVPLGTWFKTVLRDQMEEAINQSSTTGWFRQSAIRTLWGEHLSGRYDHRKALWNFLVSMSFQANVQRR